MKTEQEIYAELEQDIHKYVRGATKETLLAIWDAIRREQGKQADRLVIERDCGTYPYRDED